MPLSLKTRFWRAALRLMFKNQKLSIAEFRANSVKNSQFLGGLPETIQVETVEADGIQAEWLTPHNANPAHVILFFHGGGYVTGSIADHRMMCGLLAEAANTKVLVPEYRLAPEHPFPAAVDDALKVYHWLLKQGFSSEKIILAGDSAGGGLSLAAALALKEKGESLPAAILCLSPWADLTLKGDSHTTRAKAEVILKTETLREWSLCYTDEANLSNPLVSPVFGDFRGFPPIFIQVGSDEVLLNDALMVTEKARSAGVDVTLKVWDGMWHVWQALGNLLPENKKTFEEIARFVKSIYR